MGLASVMTTIIGLISGIGKHHLPYIGYKEVKMIIYLVKGGLQGVFIGYDEHPSPYIGYRSDAQTGLCYEMPIMVF